jgi:MGT family glycosyltransferase
MGTLVNGSERVYRSILEVMREFPGSQLVLSVGKNVLPSDLEPIPPNTIIVSRAPQLELLKRAALCITHAGMNTVLEALAHGVPMVAIPVRFDHPGIAARIAYHGVGEFIEVTDLTAHRLESLIKRVTEEPQYRANAQYFGSVIAQRHGVELAADIIESAFA